MGGSAPPPDHDDGSSRAEDFSSLFEFLPVGAYRTSPEGRVLRVNPALVRLNGYGSEAEQLAAVQGNTAGDWYVALGRREAFLALMNRDGRVTGFESEVYRHRTRERIWISENAHAVRDARGQVNFFEGTVEEITDRVAARRELARSREELRQIVELVPGMVYRVLVLPDGQRRATFVSSGIRELFELDPAEVMADGHMLNLVRHVDDRERIEAEVQMAARARRPLQQEYRVQLASGRVKWVQAVSAAAPPDDGHEVRVGMAFDITARKEAELALQANSELWKRALESTGDGVWDWHVQDGLEILSPQCRALYGYSLEELPDRPEALDALTHPDDKPRMQADREAHFAGRTPSYVNEHRVRCKDGHWKWILSRGIVISRRADGTPLRMIGTHTDITADKQAEALRIERDSAAAADRAKSAFLSRVSHELRTPLNAILGFAQLLELEPGDGEKQRGWNQHVLASGRHLLGLMDDILDISTVQTGHLAIHAEPIALHPALEEAWTMLAATAQAQQVTLVNELPPGLACVVQADRKRLRQVLSNLLSNAIKYNRSGGWVKVSVRALPQGPSSRVELRVADSGPGLSAEQQARLFNPFDRLGAERGPVAGTGLGLALSRQLCEAMGASIRVESAPGQGAIFCVDLPAA